MKIYSDTYDALLLGEGAKEIKKTEVDEDARKVYADFRLLIELMPDKEEEFENLKLTFQYYKQFSSRILDYKQINQFYENKDDSEKFKDNKLNLITAFENVTSSSSKELSTAMENLRKAFQATNIVVLIITLVAVLAGIIAAFIISSTLTRPIYNLVDTMREVENDNYDISAKVMTKDEIGKLAITFNSMTKQIKISRENLKIKND